ncbi:MAG: heat shock protein transcriptional repressor HspR [Kineosporiaceae bacterium]
MSERRLTAYVISAAAQLAGMHPQTLRQYDREGLVSPARTRGGGRRYSDDDVQRLREVQRLSQEEGVNLAGIRRILVLQGEVDALRDETRRLREEVAHLREDRRRVWAAGPAGEIVALAAGRRPAARRSASRALVVWRPGPRD